MKQTTVDVAALRQSGQHLLDAARLVARQPLRAPAPGEWTADQVLGHVALVDAATLSAVYAVTAGFRPSYDNRIALDRWSIRHALDAAGGRTGIQHRVQHHVEALAAVASSLSAPGELDLEIPAVLVSDDTVLVDHLLSVRDILTGLVEVEWPTHARQLLDLVSM